jgi:hypothetical protein
VSKLEAVEAGIKAKYPTVQVKVLPADYKQAGKWEYIETLLKEVITPDSACGDGYLYHSQQCGSGHSVTVQRGRPCQSSRYDHFELFPDCVYHSILPAHLQETHQRAED